MQRAVGKHWRSRLAYESNCPAGSFLEQYFQQKGETYSYTLLLFK